MTDEPETNEPSDTDEDLSLLKRHISQLMEHFDSVEIFVTRQEPDSLSAEHPRGITSATHSGDGNWYARFGQINEWLIQERERIADHFRRDQDEEDD